MKICPAYSSGCMTFIYCEFSWHQNLTVPQLRSFLTVPDPTHGQERVRKDCGPKEIFGIDYKEKCDTIKVPFKRKECYCRGHLCNGASKTSHNHSLSITLLAFAAAILVSLRH